jgi:xylose isomerase
MAGKQYRFTFGPWNLSNGADPFGPAVREAASVERAVKVAVELGYHGIQFHDDEAFPADLGWAQTQKECARVRKMLEDNGLVAEFVAPRLWEDPRGVDGAITANDPACRAWALERSKRAVDIGRLLGTRRLVLWPAREGTYIRESKDAIASVGRMVEYLDALLEHDKEVRILGEMKPNEPMDSTFCPTVGHFLALAYRTSDPSRVGALIESALSILAGLDPSDDMAFALWHGRLWGVHLNDQGGLKYDEDKSFGSHNLRRAFTTVYVLENSVFGLNGEMVGMDVKPMRTQPADKAHYHLKNSKETFQALLGAVRSADQARIAALRAERDYESLDRYILDLLMGR